MPQLFNDVYLNALGVLELVENIGTAVQDGLGMKRRPATSGLQGKVRPPPPPPPVWRALPSPTNSLLLPADCDRYRRQCGRGVRHGAGAGGGRRQRRARLPLGGARRGSGGGAGSRHAHRRRRQRRGGGPGSGLAGERARVRAALAEGGAGLGPPDLQRRQGLCAVL